jgi:signal transduction histidine kinase
MTDGAVSSARHNRCVTGYQAGPWHPAGWRRRAWSFITAAEQRSSPSGRQIIGDAVLAAAGTIAVLATSSSASVQPVLVGPQLLPVTQSAPNWQLMTILGLTTAPLVLRRTRPLTAFWVIVVAAAASPHYAANLFTLAAVVVAAYSAVAYSRFRGAAILSMPAVGLLDLIYLQNNQTTGLPPAGLVILIMFPVLIAATTINQWRRQAVEAKARIARLESEHEQATVLALKQERARIASELHDVVTHNVSVMLVQAGAARQVLTDSPAQAREALLAVESSGRAAMAELRNLLGLLAPADGPAGSGADGRDLDLQPQPGLDRLTALIDRVRATGLPVELELGGVPPDLPPGLDLAAYRVVQEALTNVLKHAGRPATSVRVGSQDGDLVVQVADAGRPMPAVGPAPVPGAGRGLLGLRERAELYGGELTAGPRPAGGWQVTARLPVAARAEAGPAQAEADPAQAEADPAQAEADPPGVAPAVVVLPAGS